MKFKINNRFKSMFACLLAVGLFFAMPTMATQQDTVVEDTIATAQASIDTVAAEAPTADSTAAAPATDTTVAAGTSTSTTSTASSTTEEVKQIDPQVYKNLTYYILLFLVVCTIIAVVGKILSIYELTRKMNGKYNPFANNTFQGILLLLFLVFFLWSLYYGYSVWGSWAWRSAVT